MGKPKIGHATHDENGHLWGGKAGDQGNSEVFIRHWYNRPWTVVIRFKDPEMAERNAIAMERACANDNIGYDQYQRNTALKEARKVGYDPGKITKKVETDCSAIASICAMYAGIPEKALYKDGNSPTTSVLRQRLEATGKVEVFTAKKYCTSGDWNKRGDFLLYPGHHVAIQLEDGDEVKKQKAKAKKTETKKEQTSSTTTKPTETASRAPSVPYMLEIIANSLNVRKNAGTQYDIVGGVKQGDICWVTKVKNGWGYIGEGWISLKADYSKEITSFTGKVTAGLLNVRSKSSTDGKVLKTIKKGTTVLITKLNDNVTWGYDTKSKGWVSLKFVKY